MIRAFYTATAGANSNQTYLDVISNNLANLQTEGYKSLKPEFSDLLYTNLTQAGNGSLMVGSGSKIDKTDTLFNEGTLIQTDKLTDFAILGDGFFAIQKEDEILYTRTGAFTVGNIDGENYLMLDSGYVLDNNEEPIILTEGENEINIGVYKFTNNFDLERVGNNLFRIANENAEYEISEVAEVKRGYIEGSNVVLSQEMVKMIQTQRAFQFNSRIIQVADEIEQTINSLRG
ncbi:MAG TPA: flagellar hook-basal body protein [Clostridiales bacterium]|nr:flagellar hook-basal body protein [Clostridiales bacterium]